MFLDQWRISGPGKTSRLLNLIKHQQTDVDKISLYIKDPPQSKRKSKEQIWKKNLQAFIDYSQTIDDVYEQSEDYNLKKKRKALIVFDDMTQIWKLIKN